MQHRIAILGGTTWDQMVYLPQLPRQAPHTIHQAGFREAVGSTGSGKALALTRLGIANWLYSAVGDDVYGSAIRQSLAAAGVALHLINDPAGTERHINLMDATGGRISIFVTQSSEKLPHDTGHLSRLLDASTVIVLNIIAYCRDLIPLLQHRPQPIWTDLHDYDGCNAYHQDFMDAAAYIHLSSDNLPGYRSVMEALIRQGKELVICTHGRQGASLLTREGIWLEQPALPVETIVDSNGAGDSFFAGFLYGWLNGAPLRRCMQYGAVCGAAAVSSPELVHEKLSPAFLEEQLRGQGL